MQKPCTDQLLKKLFKTDIMIYNYKIVVVRVEWRREECCEKLLWVSEQEVIKGYK